jgi:PIN domain nuclease of toxin-antitoxin system
VPALPSSRLVVDASFLIDVADQEPYAARFLTARERMVIPAVNFGEVLYPIFDDSGMPAAQTEQNFAALGISIDDVPLADVRHYPELRRIDAASRAAQAAAGVPSPQIKSLSLADMTCLGYALQRQLPVLTGDRHWTTLGALGLNLDVFDFRDSAITL